MAIKVVVLQSKEQIITEIKIEQELQIEIETIIIIIQME